MTGFREALPDRLDWLPWGPEALAAADAADRPVAAVLGEACEHWSTRFARELADDDEVQRLLAECYVCVAAEPAGQPALAARVQQVLSLNGARGWPAVAVLLPGGACLGAVPYAPMRDGGKRAGLARVLLELAESWREHRADLEREAAHAAGILAELGALGAEAGLPQARLTLDRAEAEAMAAADTLEGGFGPPPRYHQPALLGFLLRRCARPGAAPAVRDQLQRSFDALLAGGVHDHLAGGFFHGATDGGWSRPFCDKRLADNAQLALLLGEAAAVLEAPRYRVAAEQALAWCLGELAHGDGGCVAALHADSPGGDGQPAEGACYAWSEAAAAAVVGSEQAALFAHRYLSDERGTMDANGEFRIPALRGEVIPTERERLPAIVRRLAVARSERPQPPREEHRRSADQGLLLLALARVLAEADGDTVAALRPGAEGCVAAIRSLAPGGALRSGDAAEDGIASVRDLVCCARGLLAWGGYAGDEVARNQALLWAEQALDGLAADGQVVLADPLVRPPVVDALDAPDARSSAAHLAELLVEAHAATGAMEWRHRAQAVIEAHAGALRAAPLAAAGLCAVWLDLEGA